MILRISRFAVTKRYPLTISRGTSRGSENVLVEVEHDGIIGLGEMAPSSGGPVAETAESAIAELERLHPLLAPLSPFELQRVDDHLDSVGCGRAARAALDCALHDWLGKAAGLPLWKLLGLDLAAIPPTSLTVGMDAPELLAVRVPEILTRTGARSIKVKLGSPAGIEEDRRIFQAVRVAADRELSWRVDANGGWSPDAAREMIPWLADRGVEFVEQPLTRGMEESLPALRAKSPLPIYLDESVRVASDIPPLCGRADGINLKLMKCGGIREAMRMVHTARACGMALMIGCMSESSLAITAAAQISPLLDAIDLDSHLNLLDDPFLGAGLIDGRIIPNSLPGLGVCSRAPV